MKKIYLVAMTLLLIAILCACGNTPASNAAAEDIADKAATITEPVTIEFWHDYSGSLKDMINELIWEFNTTNDYGITVQGIYTGTGSDILKVIKDNYNTGSVPDLLITGSGLTEVYAESGVLADLAPYVARDGFDMENIPESLRYYSEYYDGKVIQFPYLVNGSITYYRKEYFPNGFPTDVQEWVAQAKKITAENSGVYGMGLPIDSGYTQRPFLRSMGSPGFTTENGTVDGCLADGSLERLMNDWISWLDGGFCHPVAYKDEMVDALREGKVAAITTSCVYGTSSLSDSSIYGYAPCAGYGSAAGGLGGGGLCVLAKSSDQEIAACWEFLKFLYEDENVIRVTKLGGYIPMTYSAAKSTEMQAFWETYPAGKVAFEALNCATYNEWSVHMLDWREDIRVALVDAVQNRTTTVADAIAQLERYALIQFK